MSENNFSVLVYQRGCKEINDLKGFVCAAEPSLVRQRTKRFLITQEMKEGLAFKTATDAANWAFSTFRKYPYTREYWVFDRTTGNEVLHEYAH